MNLLILVVDDEPDVELVSPAIWRELLRGPFGHGVRSVRADALEHIVATKDRSLILILIGRG